MQTLHLSIPIRKAGTNALQVIFAERRGPLDVCCKHRKHRRTSGAGRSHLLVLGDSASAGASIPLEVSFDGEAVRVIRVEERSLTQAQVGGADASAKTLGFATAETSVDDIFRWREGRVGGPFAREQRFFNDMDRQTWVSSPAQDQVLALLTAVFTLRQAGDLAAVATKEDSADEGQITAFSNLLKGCMQTHFGDPLAHVVEIEDAFDRFARGELSLLDGSDSLEDPTFHEYKARACQPDSAYYMYFAEFASVCIRKRVDVALWKALLPVLVHTQEICFDAYRGPGGDPLPLGLPLGGRWPPPEDRLTTRDAMHAARTTFRTAYLEEPDAVRINFARQFVQL